MLDKVIEYMSKTHIYSKPSPPGYTLHSQVSLYLVTYYTDTAYVVKKKSSCAEDLIPPY